MKKTSIMLDAETRKLLDDYCSNTGMKLSDAFRQFIRGGVAHYKKQKESGFIDNIGPEGLMVNEKRAIRAAIESLFIVRSIANDKKILEEAEKKTDDILKQGWFYDNK